MLKDVEVSRWTRPGYDSSYDFLLKVFLLCLGRSLVLGWGATLQCEWNSLVSLQSIYINIIISYHFNRPCFILTLILIKSATARKAFVKCVCVCDLLLDALSFVQLCVVSWSFLLRLFWFLNWAGRSLLLVAGLLKELKIANAGILGATQVKSGYVRTFHELLTHHVFSCLFMSFHVFSWTLSLDLTGSPRHGGSWR